MFQKRNSLGLLSLLLVLMFVANDTALARNHMNNGLFPSIRFFSPTEYLQHPQTWDVTADENGLLYFANMNGIMRFNGERWDFFATPGSPMAIHAAKDGTLYTALNGDLGYMNRLPNGRLEYVSLLSSIEHDILPFIDTYSIFDLDGHVYFITDSSIIHKDGETWNSYTGFTSFFVTDFKSIMLLQSRDRSLLAPSRPDIEFQINTTEPLRMIHGLFPQPDGSYIAFGFGGVTYLLKDLGDSILITDHSDSRFEYLSEFRVYDFLPGSNNEFIILTRSDGIYITDQTGNMLHHFDEDSGLRNNFALSAWIDPFKNLWLTGYYGISKVRFGSSSFVIDERAGFRGEIWDAIIFDNSMFVSTNRGIFKALFDNESLGTFKLISTSDIIDSVGEFHILPNPRTGSDALFFQSPDALFEIVDSNVSKVSSHIRNHPFYTPLYPDILFGSDGFLGFTAIRYENGTWIASEEEVIIFNDALLDVVPVHAYEFLASYFVEGLIRIRFKSPHEDDNNTWITGPFGIQFNIEEINKEEIVVPLNHIGLRPYNNSILLIARDGFFKLNEDKTQILPYPLVENNSEWVYVDHITDKHGNHWFLRTQTNLLDIQFAAFDSPSFRINIPTGNYSIPTTAFFICCKNQNAVFLVSPERIHVLNTNIHELKQLPRPKIFLLNFSISDGTLIDFLSGNEVIKGLRLPYQQNTLSFEVGTNFITSSNKNKYQFFLQGADNDFSRPSPFNAKEYINLREGDYTLWVRLTNAYGQTVEEKIITFSIAPPFYRSNLAYFLYFILLFGLVFIGYRSRVRSVEDKNKLLQQLIDDRTAELFKQKEKLEQVNQIKLRLLRMTAHDLRSPLSAITGYAELIKHEDDPEDAKVYAQIIHDTSENMRSIIQSMLASGSRNLDQIDLQFEEINLKEIVNQLLVQSKIHLSNKKQQLTVDLENNLPNLSGDKIRINEVLDNLISNAIKYSPKSTSIYLKARHDLDTNSIIINITDEGPGFTEDDLTKVFGENQTLSAKPTGKEQSIGYGLYITKQLIHAHGGEIIIRNRKSGSGADIVVILPAMKKASTSSEIEQTV